MFPLLAWLSFLPGSQSHDQGTQKFYETVLSNYSSDIPVWDDTNETLVLQFGIPFIVLGSMTENQQLVSYIAKVRIQWIDPRLTFDPDVIGDHSLVIPAAKIWIPTFEVYNSMDVHQPDKLQADNEAKISSTGTVTMLWKARFDVICQLAMDKYPFDSQWCPISFSCGLSDVARMRAVGLQIPGAFLVGTPEWDIFPPIINQFYFDSMGMNISLARISYHLKRNPEFYIFFLILPTFLITTTCLVALLFPIQLEIGEKINLCLAALLGLTFMLSIIVQELPRTSRIPLMGKWLIIQMFFCIGGCLAEVPISIVRKRYRKDPKIARIFSVVLMLIVLLAYLLTSVLLFAVRSKDLNPGDYQTL